MSCAGRPVCCQADAYPGRMVDDGPHGEPPAEAGTPEPAAPAAVPVPVPAARERRPDELRDAALHEEIELVGQLVVAATSTPHRLTQTEIDKVLGVDETP